MAMTPVHPSRGAWARWWHLWALSNMPVAAVGLLLWSASAVTAIGLSVAAAVGLSVLLMEADDLSHGHALMPSVHATRRAGLTAVCAAVVAIGALVTAALLPALLLVTIAAQALTTPPARRRLRAARGLPRRGGVTAESAPPIVILPDWPAPPQSSIARDLSDEALRKAWQRSFWTLRSATGLADVLAAVAVRQCLLDEMERRDPMALRAWLSSGARPSGGPDLSRGESG